MRWDIKTIAAIVATVAIILSALLTRERALWHVNDTLEHLEERHDQTHNIVVNLINKVGESVDGIRQRVKSIEDRIGVLETRTLQHDTEIRDMREDARRPR